MGKINCNEKTNCELVDQFQSDIVDEFLVQTRRLQIVGEINEIMSTYICNYLQFLSVVEKPIFIYINSPGGCFVSGYAIIDQMNMCNCPVYTIVRGQAHSMAAIIAAFGTKGYRFAMPNASLMLHALVIQNTPDSIGRYNRMDEYINEDYLRKVKDITKRLNRNMSSKRLVNLMEETKWMSPLEAIDIGIIDGIWTPRQEQAINNEWSRINLNNKENCEC